MSHLGSFQSICWDLQPSARLCRRLAGLVICQVYLRTSYSRHLRHADLLGRLAGNGNGAVHVDGCSCTETLETSRRLADRSLLASLAQKQADSEEGNAAPPAQVSPHKTETPVSAQRLLRHFQQRTDFRQKAFPGSSSPSHVWAAARPPEKRNLRPKLSQRPSTLNRAPLLDQHLQIFRRQPEKSISNPQPFPKPALPPSPASQVDPFPTTLAVHSLACSVYLLLHVVHSVTWPFCSS